MPVVELSADGDLERELDANINKLVVVDFTASWCGPCRTIAPFYSQLSDKYAQARFLKLDVDNLAATAQKHNVSAMPTFLFFIAKNKVDSIRGADQNSLESKVAEWIQKVGASSGDEKSPLGQMDLVSMLSKSKVECLNESDSNTLVDCIDGISPLKSDCDEQLIISLPYNQPVKIHSLLIDAPAGKGPKNIKLFANQPTTLDFDGAASMEPLQLLTMTEDQLKAATPIALRYVKFQNVSNLQIFIENNQDGSDVTEISKLIVYGTPLNSTNMNEFKRVAGKAGEAH